MGISNAAYQQLLREYDDKQLTAIRDCRFRTQKIETQLPEVSELNSQIAEVSAGLAVIRIKGDKEARKEYESKRAALISRRNQLLQDNGYSVGDLEPKYECGLCKDRGFIDGQQCSCFKTRVTELLYDQSNIKDILKKENFGTYTLKYYNNQPADPSLGETPLAMANKAANAAWEFVQNFNDSSENLFITGPTGTGKTFLSNCIAAELISRGHEVIYLSAVKLFGILADNAFQGGRNAENTSEELYSCDLLIIDDLGTEFTNSFVQSAFFNCVNERILRGKHTVISTNNPIEYIRDNYSERIFSRIMEKYKIIKLLGDDIRIIKKMEE